MAKTNIIISALSPELFTTKRLISEATKQKHSALYLNPYQHQIPLRDKKLSGYYFHRTTGVNYDDFDLVVSKNHQLSGMKITNPLDQLKIFRSKDQQSLFFKEHSLPAIPTLLYRGQLTDQIEDELRIVSPEEKYILKMSRGNQGIGVNILESHKSLVSVLETFHAMKDQRFLIQPYIPHQREWRLFIIRGEIIACIEKNISQGDFRGNAKRSSGKILRKIPKELASTALTAFKKSALDYAGIDILESKREELLLLEINPVPGFEQVEVLSGLNIAASLLNFLIY